MVQLPLVRPAAEQPSLDYRSYPSRLRVVDPHMLIKGLSDNGYDSNKTGQVVFFHRMPHLPQGDSNRRGSFTRAGKDTEGTGRESDVSSLSIDSHISALASRTWPGTGASYLYPSDDHHTKLKSSLLRQSRVATFPSMT